MSSPRSVMLGQNDLDRLDTLIRRCDPSETQLLFDELDSATVIPDHLLPSDVVAMNSQVSFIDLDTDAQFHVKLVYPSEASAAQGHVSILAPVGAALIGLKVGASIEWPLPNGGWRRLQVVSLQQHR